MTRRRRESAPHGWRIDGPARVAVVSFLVTTAAAGPLPEPMSVRFHRAEGQEVTGQLTTWDAEGFEGSFGRFVWTDLDTAEAWHLHAQVINPDSAEEWLSLGRLMIRMPDGRRRADRALRWAVWLDRELSAIAQQFAAEADPGGDAAGEEPNSSIARRAGAAGVHARRPPGPPWPKLTDEQQAQAVRQLKEESATVFEAMKADFALFESPFFFLLYTDLPAQDARMWLERLDVVYHSLALTLKLPEGAQRFLG